MYHSISDGNESNRHPYFSINTSKGVFSQHMKFLYENNYSIVPLKGIRHYLNGKTKNNRIVVLTFDDGFYNFYENAFPVINKYGFHATVFISTDRITENKEIEYMNWHEVRELSRKNVDFGSHSVSHPKLILLDWNSIEYEIAESKKIIEDEIKKKVTIFSYPYAFPEVNRKYVSLLRTTLLNAGYEIGVTTKIGTASKKDDTLFLKRLPINSYDDLLFFKSKLAGGYNWLYGFQYLVKQTKRQIFNEL